MNEKNLADRSICVNHGCNKLQAHDGRRWRVHCGHCQGASYGRHAHAHGVTPFKTGRCSNIDGHLKFACPVDWTNIPMDAKGMTEIDHKDGDRRNNHPDNLEELCPMCHKIKGQRMGNYNSHRYSKLKKFVKTVNENTTLKTVD